MRAKNGQKPAGRGYSRAAILFPGGFEDGPGSVAGGDRGHARCRRYGARSREDAVRAVLPRDPEAGAGAPPYRHRAQAARSDADVDPQHGVALSARDVDAEIRIVQLVLAADAAPDRERHLRAEPVEDR